MEVEGGTEKRLNAVPCNALPYGFAFAWCAKPMKEEAGNFQRLLDNPIKEMEDIQIFNNYKLFMELLRESTLPPKLIYTGVQKFEILYIELNKQKENP